MQAIKRNSNLWDSDRVRTWHRASPHKRESDIILRFQDWEYGQDYADRVLTSTACVDYPALLQLSPAQDIIDNVMLLVCGRELGRVYITKISPGSHTDACIDRCKVAEARFPDRPVISQYYKRYTLAIQSANGTRLNTGDETIYMSSGELWRHDNLTAHSAFNGSGAPWIRMELDIC